MKHNICNHKWLVFPNNFLFKTRCPKCNGKFKKTTKQFKEEIYNLIGSEYELIGEYIRALDDVIFKHIICGYQFKMRPNSFLNGQRCPKCAERIKYTTETFKEKIYELTNGEYNVLGEYINNKIHILIKHNICNHEYSINPNAFLKGCRCPKCGESKGEQEIRHILEYKKLNFKPQYTFDDLLSNKGNLLKFDFGILDKNNNLIFLIEYDGGGHYDENIFGKESYELTIYHDQLKNQYCQQNNISLLRIPYWEFDIIEEILEEYLYTMQK